MSGQSTTHSELRRLDALVGEWQMDAIVAGQPVARARTVFEWIEGGAYLVQHTEGEPALPATPPEWVTGSPFPITTIMGLDDFSGAFTMMYADGRGVHRVYQMSLGDGVWKFWGQAGAEFHQRFTGTFNDAGDVITGRIEASRDGVNWELDFDQTYTKVT
jgi:hypothetical protein